MNVHCMIYYGDRADRFGEKALSVKTRKIAQAIPHKNDRIKLSDFFAMRKPFHGKDDHVTV